MPIMVLAPVRSRSPDSHPTQKANADPFLRANDGFGLSLRTNRLIRDPVYDYITLPVELAGLVDHPLYQRLRRVAQTSLTSMVYPSATGSRFEHGLGAMHLAAEAWSTAWENASPEARDAFMQSAHEHIPNLAVGSSGFGGQMRLAVSAVGLLHDVGHPPFSHVLEDEYKRILPDHLQNDHQLLEDWQRFGSPMHEFAGLVLTRRLLSHMPERLHDLTLRVYESDPDDGSWAGAAHSIVAGEIDVDRLDYLVRDAQKAGTEFGAIDHHRLLDSLELHFDGERFRVGPGVRGRSAVETLLVQRSQSYKWITYHHRVVGSNLCLSRSVESLRSLSECDDEIQIDGQSSPLGEWFLGRTPNLNYLSPNPDEISHLLATDKGSDSPQLPLDDPLQADMMRGISDHLTAAVHDGVIIEWLQRASLLSRILLNRGSMTEVIRTRLAELITYTDAALVRSKSFMPTWKTVEEFAGAAHEMSTALSQATEAAFSMLLEQIRATSPELGPSFEQQRDNMLQHLAADPVTATNRLFSLTASSSSQVEILRASLQELRSEIRGLPGFWDLSFTNFSPIRMAGNLTILYKGEDPQSLLEYSPMVRALDDVEQNRPKLFVYFFLRAPTTYSVLARDVVHEARETLTGDFIAVFPEHVRQQLPDSLWHVNNGGHSD